jgi:hypothetical protein
MIEGPNQTEAESYPISQREPRQSAFLSATLDRFRSADTMKHRVRDLSGQGMRIDQAAGLQGGATVLVTVGQLEAVGATIVWIKEGAAGVKFAKGTYADSYFTIPREKAGSYRNAQLQTYSP